MFAAGVMVAVLLLAAVTASAPPSAAISGMPADIPAKGDTWKYNVTSYCKGVITAIGNATINVTGTVDINAGYKEAEQYHCYNYTTVFEAIGPPANPTTNTTTIMHTYYSMDGNRVIASHIYSEVNGDPTMNFSVYYNDTTIAFAPFPLEVGKTWSNNVSLYIIGWRLVLDTETLTWKTRPTIGIMLPQ
ncbi:MAG: hypothetical protein ACTSWP_01580 [Candidatus Freyarchaeota archaeon]